MFVVAVHCSYKSAMGLHYDENLEKVVNKAIDWSNYNHDIELTFSDTNIVIEVKSKDYKEIIDFKNEKNYLDAFCDELKQAYNVAYEDDGVEMQILIYDTNNPELGHRGGGALD